MEYRIGALSESLGTGRKLSPKKDGLIKLFSKVAENRSTKFFPKPALSSPVIDEKPETSGFRKRKSSKRKRSLETEPEISDFKLIDASEEDSDDEDEYSGSKKARPRKAKHVKADENPEERSRTVFVGNLPVTMDKKKVTKIFKRFGNVETVRFRSLGIADPKMPRRVAAITKDYHEQRQNVNAYVRFKEEDSAKKALELNGVEMKGFTVRVDLAGNNQEHDRKRSVFVGNLPFDIHENDLHCHFSVCGKIHNVRVVRDPRTGVGRGFAFVTFKSSDAVEIAVNSLDGSSVEGREIRVYRSVTKEKATKLSSMNKIAAIRRKAENAKRTRKEENKAKKKLSKVKQDDE